MNSILFLILFPGAAYLNQHSFNEASRYYALYSSIDPSHESYYGAAICVLIAGALDESIELFEAIVCKRPEIFYYLGVTYYQFGMYDKSAFYFNLLHGTKKLLLQSHYYLGLIKLKQNRTEETMEYFNRIPDSFDKTLLVDYLEDYNLLVRAQQKFVDGQYDAAIGLYEKVKHFLGYREIGYALALVEIKDYKKSLVLLDSLIDHSNDKQLVVRSMFEAAKVCIILKKASKAREYLKRCLTIKPDDETHFLLGKTFSDEARYDSALIYFENLPDSVDEYLFYKGRTEYFLGLWGKAEELLLLHREIFPDSKYGDRAMFILASINFKRKEYDHAIDFWNDLVAMYPNSTYAAAAQKGIGDAYFKMKEYKNALNAYYMIPQYKPSPTTESQTTLMIYETLYYLKKYPSLIVALRRFIEENPSSKLMSATRMRIAKIFFDKKEYYQSISELNKIIEAHPNSPAAHKAFIEKARVYQAIGNRQEVKKVFKQLLDDENAETYHSYAAHELSNIYFNEAKYDSALYLYNLLMDDEDYREKAIFEIAKIYDMLGQNEESEMMIDKLISEFPSSVWLFDASILKAKAHKSRGYYTEAISILHELIKKVGQKPEIFIEIGNIYFEMEDYLNARKNYLIACDYFKQKRDDAARTLLLAGDASMAIGDKKAAREYYLQANLIAESLPLKDQATAKISTIGNE